MYLWVPLFLSRKIFHIDCDFWGHLNFLNINKYFNNIKKQTSFWLCCHLFSICCKISSLFIGSFYLNWILNKILYRSLTTAFIAILQIYCIQIATIFCSRSPSLVHFFDTFSLLKNILSVFIFEHCRLNILFVMLNLPMFLQYLL